MIDRYSRPEMAALWSDAARFETWLEIELAVCEAMERAGTVPQGQAALVRERAFGQLDPARILAIEAITRHDVIAFLTHVEELAGEPARWLHLGMTSSDVLDTALALTCRAGPGADRRRHRLPARRPGRARPRARADAHDRPLARHPRRADHRRPRVRALATPRSRRARDAARARARGDRRRQDRRRGRRVRQPRARHRGRGARGRSDLRPETVATQIVARDRHAEVAVRAGAARHGDRADRARRAPLAAHRGRRGRGRLRRRAEGLERHAAQEESRSCPRT